MSENKNVVNRNPLSEAEREHSDSENHRGTLIFDGDCGFCRLWVERWRCLAGKGVTFIPSQEARIEGLDQASCLKAVQWIGEDGTRASGAEAVFRLLAATSDFYALLLKAYLAFGPFAWISRVGYGFVADHRPLFSLATKWLWGKDVRSPTFALASTWFLRALGAIYLLAFVSFWVQAPGLVGSNGISPAESFFQRAEQLLGGKDFHLLPSVLWFGAGDTALAAWSLVGVLASLAILFGFFRAPALLLAWAVYLSLSLGGGVFYQFQWDILLLETGFLAVFLTPWSILEPTNSSPPRVARFLLVWLLFRLMFSSGIAKLSSGDPTWWPDLTALHFHYFTQPLPTPLAWVAQQWPSWFQKASVLVMFFIELVLPFFIFAPRRLRLFAAAGFAILQIFIAATGNYGFFNLLALALTLLLLDDGLWKDVMPKHSKRYLPRWILIPSAAVLLALSLVPLLSAFRAPMTAVKPLFILHQAIAPFRTVNGYGLFSDMTTTRREIVIEGSEDGYNWRTYSFRFKPGDLFLPPPIVAPYMPRLDWQMWFASLAPVGQNPWFLDFVERLLQAEPTVLALLAEDPFEGRRPRFVRALLDNYQFTTSAEKKESGRWWKAQPSAIYLDAQSLGAQALWRESDLDPEFFVTRDGRTKRREELREGLQIGEINDFNRRMHVTVWQANVE